MPKKLRNGLLWAIAGLIALVFLWPHSFNPLFENMEGMGAVIIDSDVKAGKPMAAKYIYEFTDNDQELYQIREIMSRYTYRYCLDSLFADGGISGNHAGYYPEDGADRIMTITCTGTGRISIGDTVSGGCTYQVGWFGDNASLELMAEVRAVLESSDNLVDSTE